MKANEFVKKFGICEANSVILKSQYHHEVDVYLVDTKEFGYIAIAPDENDPYVSIKDLKRLVESWELVREHGSITRAKEYAQSPYTAPEVSNRLIQAIADVESCQ